MLFISSRVHLSNEDEIGDDEFWDLRIQRGMLTHRSVLPGGFADIQRAVAGQRILILVHGYNNEFADVIRAYDLIEHQTRRHMRNKYDLILGYTWPGGDSRFEYLPAKTRAGAIAPRFCENLRRLHAPTDLRLESIDVMTHSMGARVSLEALKHLTRRNVVRNLFLLASAVDNESIERDEEYFTANRRVRNSFVFHSRHDQVLSLAYRAVEFDRALGQNGPENPADIVEHSPQTLVVNCKNKIQSHGDYKSTDAVYKFLSRNVDTVQARQFSTL